MAADVEIKKVNVKQFDIEPGYDRFGNEPSIWGSNHKSVI